MDREAWQAAVHAITEESDTTERLNHNNMYSTTGYFLKKGYNACAIWCCHICAVLSRLSAVKLFCDPMECSSPGSSLHGILQARTLEWVAMFSSSSFLYIVLIYFIYGSLCLLIIYH